MYNNTSTSIQRKKNRSQYLVILLTLFFHAVMLFFLFFRPFLKSIQQQLEREKQMQEVEQTIFLVNHASPSPIDSDDVVQTNNLTEQEISKPIIEEVATEQESITKPIRDQQAETIPQQPIPQSMDPQSLLQTLEQLLPVAQQNQKITPAESKTEPKPAVQQKPKKLPTLNELLNGFLDTQQQAKPKKQEGHLQSTSTTTAEITREQIQIERYLSKMGKSIETSFNFLRSHKPDQLMLKPLTIQITLAPNGFLKGVGILQSCGILGMDDFFITVFKDASTSFPPVPPLLLKGDQYTFAITIQPPTAGHSYGQMSMGTLRW